ncbi:crotonase/enoyl-CoA hydratase family protein [Salinibacterium sp. dk2585]|uniref:crotonase/enoyl-CoA hydratase family protein n=1 Tax=unclassified Salinibacterium TaxID=2632331 RepID=UPI0011C24748|nr:MULTISPECIES: crotonase/enoyl-CoA hydratase family protein [unclassified Salinibacterium]QEE60761.1 crotonase/enoyl-CoA hydratase family protein [Salinibacterium sp. dk2585]TXK55833.1 crotonase/enoyl-CoA hydratase family protein [Salinibacterium sp. dk5596]
MSDSNEVVLEQRGHVLIIRINRPEARNSINTATARALGAALEQLNSDADLRVGVLTGTGVAFCAGQDLKALAAGEAVLEKPERGFGEWVRHYCSKPLIAAVNGYAFGGGLELALACDLIVAAEGVALGLPEVKRGLFAAGGGVPRLVQQMPEKVAMRMVLTGEPIMTNDAQHWGLVNEVVAADEVLDTALELAEHIAQNAPVAVQASKRIVALTAHSGTWEPEAWEVITEEFERVFGSEDAAEGARAFAEKREPIWKGR